MDERFSPQPKPQRQSKEERRAAARQRRVWHYGGANDWPALKQAVFSRDRYCCISCGKDHCSTGEALECAHIKTVGMGGRRQGSPDAINDLKWFASLCHTCHHLLDQSGLRLLARETLKRVLHARYGYTYDT